MKRISFKDSDNLCLTDTVLEGIKTMTRREIKLPTLFDCSNIVDISMSGLAKHNTHGAVIAQIQGELLTYIARTRYEVGDIVAIQQSYKHLVEESRCCGTLRKIVHECFGVADKMPKGWSNKMFVKAELMQHHIRITDVHIEWLQDISDKDCLREGVWEWALSSKVPKSYTIEYGEDRKSYSTPREAFAALIDKVSGRGTWDSNPLVWVYSFEMVD